MLAIGHIAALTDDEALRAHTRTRTHRTDIDRSSTPMPPSILSSAESFVAPSECSETALQLDAATPRASLAVDTLAQTPSSPAPPSMPPSPHSRSVARSLRSRSNTIDSIGSASAAALDRIEFLEVTKKVKRDGVSYYVIDVYLRRTDLIQRASESVYSSALVSQVSPTAMHDMMLRDREPDYQVEHRFAAFRELKHALQSMASKHADACTHCRTLHAYLAHSDNQSWTVKRLVKSSASRLELLEKFVNGVLSLTSESDAINRVCFANEAVTEMVERFFRRRYNRSLGII